MRRQIKKERNVGRVRGCLRQSGINVLVYRVVFASYLYFISKISVSVFVDGDDDD